MWLRKRHPKRKLWRFHGGAAFLNPHFDNKIPTPPRRYFTAALPCRHCEVCLRRRARIWRDRALHELALSSRTWFGTFTINPEHRFRFDVASGRNGNENADDVFLSRHEQCAKALTLYFKRVRKQSRVKLRYILVAEQHGDGWPHYHALLHERGPMVTKRLLQSQWHFCFTAFKLVPLNDRNVAGYVTKYIAKQALARIRASLRYGNGLIHNEGQGPVWPSCEHYDPKTISPRDSAVVPSGPIVEDCPF